MMLEMLLKFAEKDGTVSVVGVAIIFVIWQMKQHGKTLSSVGDSVKEIASNLTKEREINIKQEEKIDDIKKDVDDIKESVIWVDTFEKFEKGNDSRISLIEKKVM